jgi:LAO/AO transport system kinase
MNHDEMISGIAKGDQVTLARAISMVENRTPGYERLLTSLSLPARPALKIGISGPPGCGKSSIIACMVQILTRKKTRVGVVAIDPTSPLTGGALLADRIRLNELEDKSQVFIRSLANRGFLGGLNSSLPGVMRLLDAAGYDVIIVETVGVGQSEVDIAYVADVVLLVITPTSGDEIQMMKAGIVEISDVFVINKSDLGGADLKEMQIRSFFSESSTEPLIYKISALENHGIEDLVNQIYQLPESTQKQIRQKRGKLSRQFILHLLSQKIITGIEHDPQLTRFLKNSSGKDPYEAAEVLFKKLCPGSKDGKKD